MPEATSEPTPILSISKPVKSGRRTILAAEAEIGLSADPEILSALAADKPLDPSLDPVRVTSVRLGARRGRGSIRFGAGRTNVIFPADAGVSAGLGIYRRFDEMLKDLTKFSGSRSNRKIPFDDIPFPDTPALRYFTFFWGYDAEASARGSVALAPGADLVARMRRARSHGFCVVRAYREDPPVRSALGDLFGKSWILPGRIRSAEDLQPGTWILSEADGAFTARLGLKLGFDYNWVRSIGKGDGETLEGDAGLKIQTGLTTAFDMKAAGRFLLIVGRESLDPGDRVVRVRLHRMSGRSRDLEFNAGFHPVSARGKLKEGNLDDLAAAVLGLHGLQILEEIRQWASAGGKPSDLAAALLADYARSRAGNAREAVVQWVQKWDSLPSGAADVLWDIVRMDRETIANFVRSIRDLADPETYGEAMQAILEDVDFASGPTGKWLMELADYRIPGVLERWPKAAAIRAAARTTFDILNLKLLATLKVFLETKAGYPAVLRALRSNDLKSLAEPARSRLARFLGKRTPIDGDDLRKTGEIIHRLLTHAGKLYRAGREAMDRTLRFSFDYACSENVDRTALLDISFDFGSNPRLGPQLRKALSGDFTGVLPSPGRPAPPGVMIRDAVLTHRIRRQAHVRLEFPYVASGEQHTTDSLARFELLRESGNIYAYSLDAGDDLREEERWKSSLGICLGLALEHSSIRFYDRERSRATIDYHFMQAVPSLRSSQLERFMDLLSKLYFTRSFAGETGTDRHSLLDWIGELESAAGRRKSSGRNVIGNSLIALEVRLPGEALLAWLHAPRDRKNRAYMELSRRFQALMRRFIPLLYFQDSGKYADIDTAWPLLVYASLPVTTSIETTRGALRLNTDRDLFWDWPDERGDRRRMISSRKTLSVLQEKLRDVSGILEGIPELAGRAGYYDAAAKRNAVVDSVARNPGKRLLESLLYTEATIIESAVDAGSELARFSAGAVRPPEAVELLARFGRRLTAIFHSGMTSLFNPDAPAGRHILRNLGLLAFSDITAALSPGWEIRPAAALEITVVGDEQGFPPEGFPDRVKLRPENVLVRRRVMEPGTEYAPSAGDRHVTIKVHSGAADEPRSNHSIS